jgi:hypothetical protein
MHFGLLHGLGIFAYVLIFGFFWRMIAAHNSQNALGQGMAIVY